ncbi:hypothetical protein BT67DRAFT_373415 [Trichocladium antarcticum]|uniref:Uncharacterized protein n=1 Tax=Trichocladium antarcticum TaxID=1450529 RepID=A0AAN6UPU5_9PEZI|nr:hypothetical protein BT67DRAFT_373415 [Trichocladium antarcticum]
MSGNSNTQNPRAAEAGSGARYHEGQAHSHLQNDPKDSRSLADRAAAEKYPDPEEESRETALLKKDPTLPAKAHGNEPSRGAQIDAELQAEDDKMMKAKGQNLSGKKM